MQLNFPKTLMGAHTHFNKAEDDSSLSFLKSKQWGEKTRYHKNIATGKKIKLKKKKSCKYIYNFGPR